MQLTVEIGKNKVTNPTITLSPPQFTYNGNPQEPLGGYGVIVGLGTGHCDNVGSAYICHGEQTGRADTAVVNASDLVSGDSITISGLKGTYDSVSVGTKTVTLNSGNVTVTGTNWEKYDIAYPKTATEVSAQFGHHSMLLSAD